MPQEEYPRNIESQSRGGAAEGKGEIHENTTICHGGGAAVVCGGVCVRTRDGRGGGQPVYNLRQPEDQHCQCGRCKERQSGAGHVLFHRKKLFHYTGNLYHGEQDALARALRRRIRTVLYEDTRTVSVPLSAVLKSEAKRS